jgi:UDP-N-acetylglucosamine--dolichyl-phosphate N-acetylglucosaminephosphotransferase
MIQVNLIISALISGLIAFLLIPAFMRVMNNMGITGIDQQKVNKPSLPTSGGLPVFAGLLMGVMAFIFLTSFFDGDNSALQLKMNLLAGVLSIGIITVIGFFDDIYMKKEEVKSRSDTVEKRHGLRQWMKPLLTFFGALPLMVVMAGTSTMGVPFFGVVEFGVLYPLLLIPLAVICVSNTANMLAGTNGLEAGLMVIASFALGIFAFANGRVEASVIAFTLCLALLAFLRFNWFPSKILPGDSLTYLAGGAFVTAVILGNVEKFGIIIFLPWIIEALLKLRGRFNVRSFGDLHADGTIKAPYDKIYSLTHVFMLLPEKLWGKRLKENQVTLGLLLLEAVVCLLAFSFYVTW